MGKVTLGGGLMNDMKPASPWRKSSEFPPPKDGTYFLANGANEAVVVQWYEGDFEDANGQPHNHFGCWMPIPELPNDPR